MVDRADLLPSFISQIRNVSNVEDLLKLLKEVSEIGVKSDCGNKIEHKEPEMAKVYDLLAEAYDMAVEKIEKDPNLSELKRVGESYKNVVLYWRKQASEFRQELASEYLKQAREFHSEGNYTESIAFSDKALKITTSDSIISEILVHQGTSYFYNGQLNEALSNYEEATKLNPQNGSAWANIGTVLTNLGKIKDSQRYFEKAIETDPTNARYLASAGAGMYDVREYQRSKFFLEKAVALDNTLWKLGAI